MLILGYNFEVGLVIKKKEMKKKFNLYLIFESMRW